MRRRGRWNSRSDTASRQPFECGAGPGGIRAGRHDPSVHTTAVGLVCLLRERHMSRAPRTLYRLVFALAVCAVLPHPLGVPIAVPVSGAVMAVNGMVATVAP